MERRTEPGCFKASKAPTPSAEYITVIYCAHPPVFSGVHRSLARDGTEGAMERSQKQGRLVVEMCVGEMCGGVTGSEVIRRLFPQ